VLRKGIIETEDALSDATHIRDPDAIDALKASTSWRTTAPLRAISSALRLSARGTRRVAGLVSEASTIFLGKIIMRLLPYYRRYLPERIRRFILCMLASAMEAQLRAAVKHPAVPEHLGVATDYQKWLLHNDTLTDEDRGLIRARIASFQNRPTFSILMPVYNTPLQYLCEAIDSVVSQLYEHWELCIVDDASVSVGVRKALQRYAQNDCRVKVHVSDATAGVSSCLNKALEMAMGEWIVPMDHDDTIAEHALYLVAEAINSRPSLTIIYSDEDRIDQRGRRSRPYFKPDWDYDLFLGQNMICHLVVYRAEIAHRIGGFRNGFEGSHDWDFSLRVVEASGNDQVHHIPFILYHARQTSQTFSYASLPRATDAARRALTEHLMRTDQPADVTAVEVDKSWYFRVKRSVPLPNPLVSFIIPTRDNRKLLQACIDGLVNRTKYDPFEIVIVDNNTTEADARSFLNDLRSRPGFRILKDNGSFNFSRLINQGVAASSGEICVLLNNDIDVIAPDWLEEMVAHASRPEVGVVGAKLYYEDDTLQHGGVILGIGGVAAHQHKSAARTAHGYFGRLHLVHSLSCVTAACLAARRSVYEEVGGFDEKNLAIALNDVDFCIRVRQAGYKIIWTPHAELYHYESRSRGSDTKGHNAVRFSTEITYMRSRWGIILDNDPFYNQNLSLTSHLFDLAVTSRVSKPWLEYDRDYPPRRSIFGNILDKYQ
jgi:O-antigen biosynthesis protein